MTTVVAFGDGAVTNLGPLSSWTAVLPQSHREHANAVLVPNLPNRGVPAELEWLRGSNSVWRHTENAAGSYGVTPAR